MVNGSSASAYAGTVSDEYTQMHYGLSYREWADKEYEKCKKANPKNNADCDYAPTVVLVTDNQVLLAYEEENPFMALFMAIELALVSMALSLLTMFLSMVIRSIWIGRMARKS